MQKPEFNAAHTKLIAGVREMVEDGITEMVQHMKEPTTLESKPCTLTLTITLTPDKMRELFPAEVKRSMKLSGKQSFGTTLSAPSSLSGKCEISEYNPQMEMDLKAN